MKPARAELCDADREQLARIEALLRELVEGQRARTGAAGKRARTVAERTRAAVVHEPSDMARAQAKRILRRLTG